jgi:hypothetical protein
MPRSHKHSLLLLLSSTVCLHATLQLHACLLLCCRACCFKQQLQDRLKEPSDQHDAMRGGITCLLSAVLRRLLLLHLLLLHGT